MQPFTDQGSSASEMTAAQSNGCHCKTTDCDGQAAAAISACGEDGGCTQIVETQIPKSECPDIWIRLPRHKWPKSWSNIEDPVVLFERSLYGHPFAAPFVGKTIRGSFSGTWMCKSTEL